MNSNPPQRVVFWRAQWITSVYVPLLLLVAVYVIIKVVPDTWTGWINPPGATEPSGCGDKPVVDDLIPSWANALLSILGPALIMAGVAPIVPYIYVNLKAHTWWILMDIHNAWVGLLGSYLTSTIITASLKRVLGQPRPTEDCELESFPSGHATTAAMGYVFLILFLAGKFQVMSARGGPTGWWKLIGLGILGAVPVIVGVTRIRDYSHFPVDVLAGFVIGTFTSIVFYRAVFRWPWEVGALWPLLY